METWIVEGLMPEKAIDKLQKTGICLTSVKKIKKKQILFCINKKDFDKAVAIYPNMCYNSNRGSVYSFTRVGDLSARAKKIARIRRIAVGWGICSFFLLVGLFSSFVFRIETTGADVYGREIRQILKENGIEPYAFYKSGKENGICAQILALDGVEFCSVQKQGNTVLVEVRTNAFSSARRQGGDLVAPCDGVVDALVALGGTALKKNGESVSAGDKLVCEYFFNDENGNTTQTFVVAKAKLICEKRFEIEDGIDTVATAILYVEQLGGKILEIATDGECVVARYSVILKKNM